MSMFQLEGVVNHCAIQRRWGTKFPPNEVRFTAAVIQLQQETCYEELGDEIRRDSGLIEDARENAGKDTVIADSAAVSLCTAVELCLKERYLGNCAASASCDGAQTFANLLAIIAPSEAGSQRAT